MLTLTEPKVAFSETIAPTRLSAAYRCGLIVVAVAMLLLPLLYLALIVVTAWLVWLHVTQDTWILGGGGSGMQWRFLLYAAPAAVGIVVVFFLIKPILARAAARREPVALDPDAEPRLFAFIDEICAQVRAPRPRSVRVDCAVNASASFASGRFSLLRRDLVLTIGLPLVAGLSIRELAGVLAHEFGHFTQGGGMRLTGVVRGVNAWLARVAYERDEWDVTLDQWSENSDWRVRIILVIARRAVWVSRRVLAGLMMGGHAISCFMMRQMEYDADSYEIKIAGSDAFVQTMGRLRELNVATQFTYLDMREGLTLGTLPMNLPALIVERTQRMPAEFVALVRSGPSEKTKIFDTHPCDADRISAANAAAAPGALVGADLPATALFRDFDALCVTVTRNHFEHDLGLDLGSLKLVDTSDAIRDSKNRQEIFFALQQVFGERCNAYRPLGLRLGELEALGAGELTRELATARAAMAAAEPAATAGYEQFDALEKKRVKAFVARQLLHAGFVAVKPEDFDLTAGTMAGATSAEETATGQLRALEPSLSAFETAAARRLACAIVLQRSVTVEGTPPPHDVNALVDALNALTEVNPDLRELNRLTTSIVLIEHNTTSGRPPQTTAHLQQLDRSVALHREKIRGVLQGIPCPAELTGSAMTLAERCGLPEGSVASDMVARTVRLYPDILGRLAAVVVRVEASAGAPN